MKRFRGKNYQKSNIVKIIVYVMIFVLLFMYAINKLFYSDSLLLLTRNNTFLPFVSSSIRPENVFMNIHGDDVYDYTSNEAVTNIIENNDYNSSIIEKPIVYLYNTHQLETYNDELFENYNIKPNVMMMSYYLSDLLNRKGISTIVEDSSVSKVLKKNKWLYKESYKVTRGFLENAKKEYPSLKYFIDLHRDSSIREKTTINMNNKNYARILFIVGLENNNYKYNLEMTTKINNEIKNINPDLSRGIYKKSGPGVNGIYNQDFDKNVILIEMGGQYNLVNEVTNTLDLLSEIIFEYIRNDNYGK